MKHIVKREGKEERFDERKVYASSYAACLNVKMKKKEAELIAQKVCKDLRTWIKTRKQVSSTAIFKQIIKSLKGHNKDAAFMFETHRDIS